MLIDGFGRDCTDAPAVRRLEEAGVELELYHLTSFARRNHRTHRKLLMIDGVWSSVGSANFNNRSFRINDEVNLNLVGREFAEEEERRFEVTYPKWRRRPCGGRSRERPRLFYPVSLYHPPLRPAHGSGP